MSNDSPQCHHSFDFLREILFEDDKWPFDWSPAARATLRGWAQRCVEDESLSAPSLRDDERTILRESALAVGSLMDTDGHRLEENQASSGAGAGH